MFTCSSNCSHVTTSCLLYVNFHLLDRRQVTLDAILSDLVLNKSERIEFLRFDDLMSRTLRQLTPAYQYTLPGQAPVVKKGKLEPVQLQIQQRGSKKKVNRSHLESLV